jgi:O-acetyl-ADP-ribose deacetylase (regulator of RNase III)
MKYIKKDITEVEGPAIIAHGVNCQNVMGSGVAKALYTKWPQVKENYHEFGPKELGAFQIVPIYGNLQVANCFTQKYYGRDGKVYAEPSAIRKALGKVCEVASDLLGVTTIYIPRIGCGLGGLDWEGDVVPVLEGLETKYPVTFVVCDLRNT